MTKRPRYSPTDPEEFRILSRVKKTPSGCWIWTGPRTRTGYGTVRIDGKRVAVHRWTYERFVGTIPEGKEIDHLCRRRCCANPRHLEAVTHHTNLLRGKTIPAKNRAKRRCPAGHEYSAANTYTYRGMRYCKACRARRAA